MLRAHLPQVVLFVLLGLSTTATLTYAAERPAGSTSAASTASAPKQPLVVPDVQKQAFVFAKGALEDAGFAWRVSGSVHGYAANTVALQSPAAGTRVLDTGAPLITLTLKRNASYPESGQAEDGSPYAGTALHPANLAAAVGPEAARKPASVARPGVKQSTWPQSRPAAFTVPGARTEPLDEMPLPNRAQALRTWLEAHPEKTGANVSHWLYQSKWIVTGAKLGWWRGAEALTTLIAVDRRAQQLWGIGSQSALEVRGALSAVRSRSK